MELQGIKNAGIIVTGAAQGIGEGVARHLASGGAKLALIDRNERKGPKDDPPSDHAPVFIDVER